MGLLFSRKGSLLHRRVASPLAQRHQPILLLAFVALGDASAVSMLVEWKIHVQSVHYWRMAQAGRSLLSWASLFPLNSCNGAERFSITTMVVNNLASEIVLPPR